MIWKIIKSLYDVSKVKNHWYKIYYDHHIEQLKINSFTYDFCLLFTNINDFNVIELQTDDTLFLNDSKFAKSKKMKIKQINFMIKDKEKLSIQHSFKFNEYFIQFNEMNIHIIQKS